MNGARITPPPAGAPDPVPGTFPVVQMLAGFRVPAGDLDALQEVRLAGTVASALRAALEWLAGEAHGRPIRARADDAALEVVLEHLDGRALRVAGEVLAGVGGSLGRVESARPDAPWMVRVPIDAAREQYLMVIEGGLPVAFAWPAVIHIVMAGAGELGSGLPAPRVPAFAAGAEPAAGAAAEFPVVLLGHGLKRGYYVADRLVWRLPASPIETVTPPPVAGLTHAVQTDEGDCYWVADPAWLLQSVAEPSLEVAPAPAWAPPPEPVRALDEADVAAIELLPDEVEPLGAPEPAPRDEFVRAADAAHSPAVEPPPAPAREAAPSATPSVTTSADQGTPAPAAVFRAALVAEDSITASIFLARLLEQQGYLVRTVDSAADLARELARGDWALVCVDVELPDGRGRDHLRAVRETHERAHAGHPGPSALVALVRDREDLAEAQAAGISRVLRKPVTREALEQFLLRMGARAGGAS